MPIHSFSLIVDGHDPHCGPVLDALYERGCDDALVVTSDGVHYLDFDRTAASIEDAIHSAVEDVESVDGLRVVTVVRDELER